MVVRDDTLEKLRRFLADVPRDGFRPIEILHPSEPMILKLQQPLGGDLRYALVYDESRSVYMTVPMNEDLVKLFAEHGPRVFVEGVIEGRGVTWTKVLEDQLW